jgi:hypothetical protein
MGRYIFNIWLWTTILFNILFVGLAFFSMLLILGWKIMLLLVAISFALLGYPIYTFWYKPSKERFLFKE